MSSDTITALRSAIAASAAANHATAAAIRAIDLTPIEEGEEAVRLALAWTLGRIDGIGDRVRNHIRCAVAVLERDTSALLADALPPTPPERKAGWRTPDDGSATHDDRGEPILYWHDGKDGLTPPPAEEPIDTAAPPAPTEETPHGVILHSDAAGTYAVHRLSAVKCGACGGTCYAEGHLQCQNLSAAQRDERPGGGKAPKKARKVRRVPGPAPSTNGQ